MEKIVVLDSEEKIVLKDYSGYPSLSESVGGLIEHCGSIDGKEIFPSYISMSNIKIDIWCNEEFLIRDDEEFDKINALASLLCNSEIRGNVVFTVQKNAGESRGFEYLEMEDGEEDICECWWMEDILMLMINNNKEQIEALHAEYDGNKAEPRFEIRAWDDFEEELG